MIMSLIIILPLISADTWFKKDPTIDQLMNNYFTLARNANSTNLTKSILVEMVKAAQ